MSFAKDEDYMAELNQKKNPQQKRKEISHFTELPHQTAEYVMHKDVQHQPRI